MTKTAIAFLGIYVVCLLGSFFFPALGVWGFLFESNFHPSLHSWGQPLRALGDRWSMCIGAVALGTCLLQWSNYSDNRLSADPKTWLLALFVINAYFVTLSWAFVPQQSMNDARQFLNWFLIYLAIVKTHSNRSWMPFVLYIYILSAIYMGFDETFNHGRGRTVKQGPMTAFGENFVSAHVVALLPVTGFLAISSATPKYLRYVFLMGMPFLLNLVAHAQSRGAMLALAAVSVGALVVSKGRVRIYVILAMLAGTVIGARLFHDQFWARAESISDYEQDGSAMGRIIAWRAAWVLIKRWPLGYGAEAFDSGLGASVMPPPFHSTHSTPFEIMVAWGLQGAFLFYGALSIALFDCIRVARRTRRVRNFPPSVFESYGVGLAIVGMLVGSMFLNRMRWELWWTIMAYTSCMKATYLGSIPQYSNDSAELAEISQDEDIHGESQKEFSA